MYNVMVIAGISTVLVNGNPLLRFDGYFVLADWIEIPNLATRANRYLSYLVEKYAFGVEQTKLHIATLGERIVFLIYAPLAFVYRIFLAAGIAIFVAQQYFIVGVMIALWSMTQTLLRPIGKGIWHIFSAAKLRSRRNRVMLVTGGAAAVVAFFLLAIPMPLHTYSEGVVWLPESGYVRAGTQGFIKELAIAPGARVGNEQDLVVLEEPVLDARIRSLGWRVRELEIKLAQHKVTDRVLAEVTKIELEKAQGEYERERVRIGRLIVRSGREGRFVPAIPASDLVGRHVREGDLLGYVIPEEASIVRVAVTQSSIELVRDRLRGIELKPADRLGETQVSSVARFVPAGLFALPSPALGLPGGGEIAVDPRDKDGKTALARIFQFDLEVPGRAAEALFGGRVYVKFVHNMEPVGFQLYRWARQLFLTQFNV
jgi:putative peptide zinc metalloprotease protein